MRWENLVVDAVDPHRVGGFWEAVLGGRRLTDEPDLVETRLQVPDGPWLDLCVPRVPAAPEDRPRVHLSLRGADRQPEVVERTLGLGAAVLDPDPAAGVLLADPEGTPFRVLPGPPGAPGAVVPAEPEETGPIAEVILESADPERDREVWAWLTGWQPDPAPGTLRHPSGRGPLLRLCPEREPKGSRKNRWHLDVRLEPGEDPDEVAAGIARRGGRELHPGWGALPWRVYADPSGNELCVLPAPR